MEDLFDSPEFKKAFWDWFDNLPKAERAKFLTYKHNIAELNFYNTVWSKRVHNA